MVVVLRLGSFLIFLPPEGAGAGADPMVKSAPPGGFAAGTPKGDAAGVGATGLAPPKLNPLAVGREMLPRAGEAGWLVPKEKEVLAAIDEGAGAPKVNGAG